ncbi:hypothetical protein fHeYen801_094 [Yersinia phage fHe-Yen8-01]|nr:hypothetical protein fHeYen801_094 [Yersinia phage fHe-Yen8-01]
MIKPVTVSRDHFIACLNKAESEGYVDLIVTVTERLDVILSGYHAEVRNARRLCHAVTISGHTLRSSSVKQAQRCERWLREQRPFKRAPTLGGRIILKFDTGEEIKTAIIPKINSKGENNADAFLRHCVEFGILRHGVEPFLEMVKEQGERYPKYQKQGLKK